MEGMLSDLRAACSLLPAQKAVPGTGGFLPEVAFFRRWREVSPGPGAWRLVGAVRLAGLRSAECRSRVARRGTPESLRDHHEPGKARPGLSAGHGRCKRRRFEGFAFAREHTCAHVGGSIRRNSAASLVASSTTARPVAASKAKMAAYTDFVRSSASRSKILPHRRSRRPVWISRSWRAERSAECRLSVSPSCKKIAESRWKQA
jgi:hypothetical protein